MKFFSLLASAHSYQDQTEWNEAELIWLWKCWCCYEIRRLIHLHSAKENWLRGAPNRFVGFCGNEIETIESDPEERERVVFWEEKWENKRRWIETSTRNQEAQVNILKREHLFYKTKIPKPNLWLSIYLTFETPSPPCPRIHRSARQSTMPWYIFDNKINEPLSTSQKLTDSELWKGPKFVTAMNHISFNKYLKVCLILRMLTNCFSYFWTPNKMMETMLDPWCMLLMSYSAPCQIYFSWRETKLVHVVHLLEVKR